MSNNDYMFPTSVKEVQALGWDYIDIILVSGDATAQLAGRFT